MLDLAKVIANAGVTSPNPQGSLRRERMKAAAQKLRSAKDDDEAADAMEAFIELAKE